MNSAANDFAPDWVSPPGDTILDLMEERDWNQVELASRLGFSTKHLNRLVKGKVALTYVPALKLERVLGVPADFWMRRESKYRQHVARLEESEKFLMWVDWLDELPVKELRRVGVIEDLRFTKGNKSKLVESLLHFFGVASPDEWRECYGSMSARFRRTQENQSNNGAISSWLRLGEIAAENMETKKYNKKAFEDAVDKIRELTVLPFGEARPKIARFCLDAGVKFLLVDSIPGSHVSGVARWLNGHSPIIQLSLYGKSNDKFWFTFFHEAAHILLHSDEKKSIFLDDVDFDSGEKKEKEANVWAANLLIPKEHRIELLSLRAEGEILEFSKKVNVHPGIVVGRLQHERQIKYSSPLNRLKESLEV